MVFTKIVCPIDFSPGSRKALWVAAKLAHESSAPLVLVHVWQPSHWTVAGEFQLASSVLEDMIAAEEAELTKWKLLASELGARDVIIKFLTGAAWDQIVAVARQDRAVDLIVMGTHGRTGLKHVLLGSVAEKVVRHAPCAVLVVRPPDNGSD
jgi:nucleotide-binding universal stress UspA family protein